MAMSERERRGAHEQRHQGKHTGHHRHHEAYSIRRVAGAERLLAQHQVAEELQQDGPHGRHEEVVVEGQQKRLQPREQQQKHGAHENGDENLLVRAGGR